MKRLLGSNLAKWIVLVLTCLNAIIFAGSCMSMAVYESMGETWGSPEKLKEHIYENMYTNLAYCMVSNVSENGQYDMLSGGNLEYAIYDKNLKLLYQTDGKLLKSQYDYAYTYHKGDNLNYTTTNFLGIAFRNGYSYGRNDSYTLSVPIRGMALCEDTGLLYWITDNGYYLVENFYLVDDTEWLVYELNSAKNYYVNAEYGQRFNYLDEVRSGRLLYIGDKPISLSNTNIGYYDLTFYDCLLDLGKNYPEGIGAASDYWLMNSDNIAYTAANESAGETVFYVSMKAKDNPVKGLSYKAGMRDFFYDVDAFASLYFWWQKWYLMAQVVSLILTLAGFLFLMVGAGHRPGDNEIHTRFADRIPLLIYTGLCGMVVGGGIAGNIAVIQYFDKFSLAVFLVLSFEFGLIWMAVGLAYCMSIMVRVKSHTFWKTTFFYWCLTPVRKFHSSLKEIAAMDRGSSGLFWKAMGIFTGWTLLEAFVIIVTDREADVEMMLFVGGKILEYLLLYFGLKQFMRIREGGKRVASGDYSTPINTDRMFPEFAIHATHINAVQDGIQVAVEERMKSERFRTELITNVSHDIKTPLTSIINYVDLLKKQNIDDPTCIEYMEVLDRQSLRLKKLIEDLMEASKASTGNLEVHDEAINVGMIAGQIVGEYEEKAKAAELDLILSKPEEDIYAMLDGRHIFRVLDNVMNNAMKYAQPGTRVYVDMTTEGDKVTLAFRNTSKYALNISAEELMQRFTRGDSSRNTEGNGLGLNIAQSLTNLMGGEFSLYVDGDLFKVIISFPIHTL